MRVLITVNIFSKSMPEFTKACEPLFPFELVIGTTFKYVPAPRAMIVFTV